MLVLARKKGESLVIGDGIEITITDVAGDKVRLGINAPQDVKIVRSEIIKTQEENKSAASSADRKSVV